jgi:hypothetical protein
VHRVTQRVHECNDLDRDLIAAKQDQIKGSDDKVIGEGSIGVDALDYGVLAYVPFTYSALSTPSASHEHFRRAIEVLFEKLHQFWIDCDGVRRTRRDEIADQHIVARDVFKDHCNSNTGMRSSFNRPATGLVSKNDAFVASADHGRS